MQTDEIKQTLYEVVCVFRGWHSDGTAWSEYDQSVLDKVLKLQKQFEESVPTPSDEDRLTDVVKRKLQRKDEIIHQQNEMIRQKNEELSEMQAHYMSQGLGMPPTKKKI